MTVLPLLDMLNYRKMNRIDDYLFTCTKSRHDALRIPFKPEFN
ncbi:hypothetical protein [Prosthecochloris sp.]|nr:hypothetical protein [Prosthecochloris sp.]